MVTNDERHTERREARTCSLERIRELASQEQVAYGGIKVEKDIRDLRYSLQDVCRCLQTLEEDEFSHAERYGHGPKEVWLDVYFTTMIFVDERGREFEDELYIKLKLNADCIAVVLMSFHPENDS
jgi:hypothetical protein